MIAEIVAIWSTSQRVIVNLNDNQVVNKSTVSGHSQRVCVAGSPYLLSQGFDRQAVHLLDEFLGHHFKLLNQGPAFLDTAGSCVIFED